MVVAVEEPVAVVVAVEREHRPLVLQNLRVVLAKLVVVPLLAVEGPADRVVEAVRS